MTYDDPTVPPADPATVAADVPTDEPVPPALVATAPVVPDEPEPVAEEPVAETEPLAPEPVPEPLFPEPAPDPVVPEPALQPMPMPPPPPPPAPEPPRPPEPVPPHTVPHAGIPWPAFAAFVVLVIVAALLAYTTGPIADDRAAKRLEDRRAAALAASRQLALNLVSIDYRTLDRDLQRISDSTTGKAREEFDGKILKNDQYKKLVRDNQAVLSGTIKRIGLQPCGSDEKACLRGDTAVAVVFLDQESKNKLRPTPRVDRNRVALTLVRHDGTWLVSEVAVV